MSGRGWREFVRELLSVAALAAVAGCTPPLPPPATAPPTSAPTSAAQSKPTTAAAPQPSPVPAASASPATQVQASPAAKPAASPAAVASPSPVAQAVPQGPNGEKLVEQSAEMRFQLDLQVADAALLSYFPTGWTPNVATSGAAKDANLRAVFIDRLSINGPDGRPLGSTGTNRLVYLVAPVRDPSGATVQLVIGGLTEDPADAPGPFGNYLPATTHTMQRATANSAGPILDAQDWVFEAVSGEHLELHVKYERGVAARGAASDTKFYSARNPSFYQLSRQEQVLDILRNVTTAPTDRVKDFSFTASGGSYARLFDGTQKVLSWDNILWINRSVFQP